MASLLVAVVSAVDVEWEEELEANSALLRAHPTTSHPKMEKKRIDIHAKYDDFSKDYSNRGVHNIVGISHAMEYFEESNAHSEEIKALPINRSGAKKNVQDSMEQNIKEGRMI